MKIAFSNKELYDLKDCYYAPIKYAYRLKETIEE
jgi:hypothetical protein